MRSYCSPRTPIRAALRSSRVLQRTVDPSAEIAKVRRQSTHRRSSRLATTRDDHELPISSDRYRNPPELNTTGNQSLFRKESLTIDGISGLITRSTHAPSEMTQDDRKKRTPVRERGTRDDTQPGRTHAIGTHTRAIRGRHTGRSRETTALGREREHASFIGKYAPVYV